MVLFGGVGNYVFFLFYLHASIKFVLCQKYSYKQEQKQKNNLENLIKPNLYTKHFKTIL